MLDITSTPKTMEMSYELPTLISEGNRTDKGTILHLHGFPGGPVKEFKHLHKLFPTRGYRLVSMNYPGTWKASGVFNFESSVVSTKEMLQYLHDEYEGPLYLFGESFGGFISITVCTDNEIEVRKIGLRAPVPGLELYDRSKNPRLFETLYQSISMLVQSGILRIDEDMEPENLNRAIEKFNFSDSIQNIIAEEIPVFTVMGRNDKVLPADRVKSVYEKVGKYEEFEDLPHNGIDQSTWIELITKFDIFYSKD